MDSDRFRRPKPPQSTSLPSKVSFPTKAGSQRNWEFHCVTGFISTVFSILLMGFDWIWTIPMQAMVRIAWSVSNYPAEARINPKLLISTSTHETSRSIPGRPGRAVHFRNPSNDCQTTRNHHTSQIATEFCRVWSVDSNRVISEPACSSDSFRPSESIKIHQNLSKATIGATRKPRRTLNQREIGNLRSWL